MGVTAGFRAQDNKTEAIQEKREGRREKSILGKGSCMCKGPEAGKSLLWSQSTKEAGVDKTVNEKGKEAGGRSHGAKWVR